MPNKDRGRDCVRSSGERVEELLRTNDLVLLSWVEALLADAGIRTYLLDSHTSIVEGSIAALQRRLMVDNADAAAARKIAKEANIVLPDPERR